MEATPDAGEQFRIKLPGVDSSGVWGGRERETKRVSVREGEGEGKKCGGTTGSSVTLQGSAWLIPASH